MKKKNKTGTLLLWVSIFTMKLQYDTGTMIDKQNRRNRAQKETYTYTDILL